MRTQYKDPMNNVLGAVYTVWRNSFNEEETCEDEPSRLVSKYFGILSPMTSSDCQERLREIAHQWENTAKGNITKFSNAEQSTVARIPIHLPNLEKSVVDFAVQKAIPIADIIRYHDLIYRAFSGTKEVGISLAFDFEINDYCKIRFALKVESSIEELLNNEDQFRITTRKSISRESRAHFVLTPQLV